jgi:hypothetical protein
LVEHGKQHDEIPEEKQEEMARLAFSDDESRGSESARKSVAFYAIDLRHPTMTVSVKQTCPVIFLEHFEDLKRNVEERIVGQLFRY